MSLLGTNEEQLGTKLDFFYHVRGTKFMCQFGSSKKQTRRNHPWKIKVESELKRSGQPSDFHAGLIPVEGEGGKKTWVGRAPPHSTVLKKLGLGWWGGPGQVAQQRSPIMQELPRTSFLCHAQSWLGAVRVKFGLSSSSVMDPEGGSWSSQSAMCPIASYLEGALNRTLLWLLQYVKKSSKIIPVIKEFIVYWVLDLPFQIRLQSLYFCLNMKGQTVILPLLFQ